MGKNLLGILGRCMPPGSPNPNPILDQSVPFFSPVFRPGVAVTNLPTGFVEAELSFASVRKPRIGKIRSARMIYFGQLLLIHYELKLANTYVYALSLFP